VKNHVVLFITYDGLLDVLGASQILPYLKIINNIHNKVVVMSFEKSDLFCQGNQSLYKELEDCDILWRPISFTSGYGAFGKIWDILCMNFYAFFLAFKYSANIVHARGHLSAQVGLLIKKLLGSKLIFDCRGLWVDERVDKGGWDMSIFYHRIQYRYYKWVERKLFSQADQVVVLTKKVLPEVLKLGALPLAKITVIPCCADFNHFPIATFGRRVKARMNANIPQDALVLGYLGSVGRMYMLNYFFKLFQLAAKVHIDCHALVITQDTKELYDIMNRCLSADLHSRVHVISANREEVPRILPASNIYVSFIQPSYARIAASPTKMAECFAEGIPVICNPGVGDVVEQIEQFKAGVVVDPTTEADLVSLVEELEKIASMGGERLREVSRPLLGLEFAKKQYLSVYNAL
jgi:glycosyltransferase involved in cell wall biosynthesis